MSSDDSRLVIVPAMHGYLRKWRNEVDFDAALIAACMRFDKLKSAINNCVSLGFRLFDRSRERNHRRRRRRPK